MDANDFEDVLRSMILDYMSEMGIASAKGFATTGITGDGLIVRMVDGSEFQVSIVQARKARPTARNGECGYCGKAHYNEHCPTLPTSLRMGPSS